MNIGLPANAYFLGNSQARIFQSSLETEAGMVFSKKKSAGFKTIETPRWGGSMVLWKVAWLGVSLFEKERILWHKNVSKTNDSLSLTQKKNPR